MNKAWGVYTKENKLTALVGTNPLVIISPAIFRSRNLARRYIMIALPSLKKELRIRRVMIKAI